MDGCISSVGSPYLPDPSYPVYPAEYHTHHRYGIKWGCPLEASWFIKEYYSAGYPVRLLFQTSAGETLAYINLTIKFNEKTQRYYLADAAEHDPVAEGFVTAEERKLVLADAVSYLKTRMATGTLRTDEDQSTNLSDAEANSALLCRAHSYGNKTYTAENQYGNCVIDQQDYPVFQNAVQGAFTYCVIIGNYRVFYIYGGPKEEFVGIEELLPSDIHLAEVPGTAFTRFFIQNAALNDDYMYYTEPQHRSGSQ